MRKSIIAAGGIALAVALTGCNGDDNGALPGSKPGGSKGAPSLFGDAHELANASKAKSTDAKTTNINANIDMAGQSMEMNGQARFDGDNSAISMNVNMAEQSVGVRFVDGTVYVKLPEGGERMTGGKPWAKISPDGNDPMSQSFNKMKDQLAQNDPTKSLEQIEKAGTITKSEQTNLDGQPASHYWVDIDMKKAAEQAGGIGGEAEQQLASKAGTLPMELWLNNDQLPTQVVVDMSRVTEAAGKPGAAGKMTMKYTDWGKPVDVAAPPADQVGELNMPSMGGSPGMGDGPNYAGSPGMPGKPGSGGAPAPPAPGMPGKPGSGGAPGS